jgi:serine/threonine-protein kinase
MSHGSPPSEHELSPGDVCDGYRISSLIAAGGMGDVYEAVHDPTGRTVAVKCLKVRHRNKEDARARMKMEAVVLSELQHENLVQVYDAGVTDQGMVWFAMERLHGQTLRDVLFRAGSLPIPDALHYASEIADGADAVHEVNVIHRDLKPENVFVTDGNVVKVLDLGTGKFTGYGLNSTDRMRVVGTTAYMSPEQIKGLRVDARADVYALGLILYEMIAGRHALTPEDAAALPQGIEQVALMQLQMTPKALADVALGCPRYVSAIADRAIAKDRERRYPNMAALARELRAARKRFVAENQFDVRSAPAMSEGLREKFGAPPRSTPAPRASAPPLVPREVLGGVGAGDMVVSMGLPAADTVADQPCAEGRDAPTEIQVPIDMTVDGMTPAPGYVPTVLLSSSSVPGLPAELGTRSDLTDRGLPPDDVRNRTTQTNPIGFVRAAEPAQDDSIEIDFRAESWLTFWRFPFVRRAVATLALGAIIGVPPAILGVLWTRHHGGLPTFSFARPTSPEAMPVGANVGPSPAGPAVPPHVVSAGAAMIAAPPEVANVARPLSPRDAASAGAPVVEPVPALGPLTTAEAAPVRVPRGRSKPPVLATASALFQEGEGHRGDVKRPAPASAAKAPPVSIPMADPISTTILPPSGL